jgi:1-deoxy-D-xylulose-5-phosphate reductoisomerase
MRSISVLGATGSIGASTLDLVRRNRDQWRVVALTANGNAAELGRLAREFSAEVAVVADEVCLPALRESLAGTSIVAAGGSAALIEAASRPADVTVAAIVGCAGLAPTMAAIAQGRTVALANKEALVSAGEVMTAAVRASGATLLPVDSEHNAIFQCLAGNDLAHVRWITLTASGGPFRDWPAERLAHATPAEAVKHPNWSMGAKISVDSATMMNKGLEVIEAHWLFACPAEQIQVVVHPQSVIHSLVEYTDGSVLAQLGNPDMRTPIAYALAYPERIDAGVPPLDLFQIARLDFEAPDFERFPCLELAYAALRTGGTAPAILNAANEVAVAAFLDRRLSFTGISRLIEETLSVLPAGPEGSLTDVLMADAEARRVADRFIRESAIA